MNSRAMEALLFRAHEERMSAMRGCDLPKHERGDTDADVRVEQETARAELTKRIIDTFKAHADWSAQAIAKRCGTSHPTVLRELRKAGLR